MTPPDPVEENVDSPPLQMVWAAVSHLRTAPYGVTGTGKDARDIAAWLESAALDLRRNKAALLADTQSKDERIAELEGEKARLRAWLRLAEARGAEEGYYALHGYNAPDDTYIESVRVVPENAHPADRAALAGTGVASDGGEDGE